MTATRRPLLIEPSSEMPPSAASRSKSGTPSFRYRAGRRKVTGASSTRPRRHSSARASRAEPPTLTTAPPSAGIQLSCGRIEITCARSVVESPSDAASSVSRKRARTGSRTSSVTAAFSGVSSACSRACDPSTNPQQPNVAATRTKHVRPKRHCQADAAAMVRSGTTHTIRRQGISRLMPATTPPRRTRDETRAAGTTRAALQTRARRP